MPAQPVVVVLHGAQPPDRQLLRPVAERAEIRLVTEDQLAGALPGADVLFAYDFANPVIGSVWSAADRLQWLHVAAAGVDAQLTPQVRDSDVVLTNSRGVFDGPIAEYVLAQVLAFAKDLAGSRRLQAEHQWQHRESTRLAGTRALVVGTGNIGRAIARLLRAVGVDVTGAGRRARTDDPDFGTVVATDAMDDELGRADWVIAVAPLTKDSRGLFDAARFAAMTPRTHFINVGRGELVDTDALVAALQAGQLAGAALDVVDPEPLPPGHPLWDLPQVAITPHNSGDFVGWQDALTEVFVANFERWVAGQTLQNVVDKSLGYVPNRPNSRSGHEAN